MSDAGVASYITSEQSTTFHRAFNSFLTELSQWLVLFGAPSSEQLSVEENSSVC